MGYISILVIELYKIVYEFDVKIVIKLTLGKMLEFTILLILYINLKLLYNY